MSKTNKIGNEKGEVTIDTAEIQRIIRDYYKQSYAKTMDNGINVHILRKLHLSNNKPGRSRKYEQINQEY